MDAVAAVAGMDPAATVRAGAGASFADPAAFQGALTQMQAGLGQQAAGAGAPAAASAPGGVSPALKGMFTSLDRVDREAKSVAQYADAASAAGKDMSPGEVISLTMRCQEFMFHCQLTSNIANRSSDGLQQLFRQQS